MADFIGEICQFAGAYTPHHYLDCDGRTVPIGEYAALFATIGVTYGGDGRTSFALPDLRPSDPVDHHIRQWVVGEPRWVICCQGDFPRRT
jgi:microcystin-dependent protein